MIKPSRARVAGCLPLRWAQLAVMMCLVSCTTVEFEGTDNRLAVSPAQVVAAPESVRPGTVVWGGRILEIVNLESGTEILVLALPLNSGNVPRIEQQSIGRFVARKQGYLEPMDFAPGRYVSLAGDLLGTSGEWQYEGTSVGLPLVEIRQLHLWPANPSSWHRRMNVGISIAVHK